MGFIQINYEVKDKPLMSIYEADENHNVKTLFA